MTSSTINFEGDFGFDTAGRDLRESEIIKRL